MKQKIIIKVSMHCDKCRTKALQIAATAEGVTYVAFHGPEKDKLMIEGDGVDAACLTSSLRRKLCHANLEIVEEVKPPAAAKPQKETTPTPPPIVYCQPQVEYFRVVADPSPSPCTIM